MALYSTTDSPTASQPLDEGVLTFGQVLSQGLHVEGAVLPGGVRTQLSSHGLHLLLQGRLRILPGPLEAPGGIRTTCDSRVLTWRSSERARLLRNKFHLVDQSSTSQPS